MEIDKQTIEYIEKIAGKDQKAAAALLKALIERDEKEQVQAALDPRDEQRIQRFVKSMEKKTQDMQYALKKYSQNPAKYRPQLDNLQQDLTESQALLRRLLDAAKNASAKPVSKDASYVGEGEELAELLKKKWRTVTYRNGQGKAKLPYFMVEWTESQNDNAAVVHVSRFSPLKGMPEQIMKAIEALSDAYRFVG